MLDLIRNRSTFFGIVRPECSILPERGGQIEPLSKPISRSRRSARGATLVGHSGPLFAPTRDGRTIFIGLYEARLEGPLTPGATYELTGETINHETAELYTCTLRPELAEFIGRLVIDWGPGTRSWGQKGTTDKPILELLRTFEEPAFPGYLEVMEPLSAIPTLPNRWVDFLRQGKGVYLLTCPRTKEQYVGKADGGDGFWGRWLSYATTGDGGNVRLKSRERSDYQVSILEVAGSAATADEILRMEMHWKAKLQTREMGLNGN